MSLLYYWFIHVLNSFHRLLALTHLLTCNTWRPLGLLLNYNNCTDAVEILVRASILVASGIVLHNDKSYRYTTNQPHTVNLQTNIGKAHGCGDLYVQIESTFSAKAKLPI